MKAVVADAVWQRYIPTLLDLLETNWSLVAARDPGHLEEEIAGADAAIGLTLPPGARAAARRLKLFHFPGAGAQHFSPEDFPAGCVLCNVYEHEIAIAEYVLSAMLLHVTGLGKYPETFRRGSWEGSGRLGGEPHGELSGKTVGLIGYGHIGQAVAARARAFGMSVFAVRLNPLAPAAPEVPPDWVGGPGDLGRLLEASDFLVIACPLSEGTRAMLGAEQLALLKPSSMLINVSRAEIVEEEALFEVLRERRIAAAALDVWYRYPGSLQEAGHGSRFPFHELGNAIATPHLSGHTHSTIQRRIRKVAGNLDRLASGRPLQRVVLEGTWRPAPG